MKTLRFLPRTPVVQFTTNDKGVRQRIIDKSEWQHLRVRKDDAGILYAVLQWSSSSTDLLDFAFNPRPTADPNVHEVLIQGRFDPELNKEIISQLVSDWKLLSPHFATRADVLKPELPGKVVEILLKHLLNGKQKPLPEWVMRMLKLREEG